jgi:hypothetical protein
MSLTYGVQTKECGSASLISTNYTVSRLNVPIVRISAVGPDSLSPDPDTDPDPAIQVNQKSVTDSGF